MLGACIFIFYIFLLNWTFYYYMTFFVSCDSFDLTDILPDINVAATLLHFGYHLHGMPFFIPSL